MKLKEDEVERELRHQASLGNREQQGQWQLQQEQRQE